MQPTLPAGQRKVRNMVPGIWCSGFSVMWIWTRLKDYKYSDGTFKNWNLNRPSTTTGEITNFKPLYWNNPYFEVYENPITDSRDRFFGDVGLTYQLMPGLSVSGFVRSDMFIQNIEEKTAVGGRRISALLSW